MRRRIMFGSTLLLIACCWSALPSSAGDELVAVSHASEGEPVAPMVAGFERFGRPDEIAADASGALLLSELSCTACHTTEHQTLQPKAGPKLESVAQRLQPAWIVAFLNDPSAAKPGTTMPDVLSKLSAREKENAVEALAAFLASQRTPLTEPPATGLNPVPHQFWIKGDPSNGKQLMHQVGCVACHEPAADYEGGIATNSALDALLEELEPEEIAKMGLSHAIKSVPSVPWPRLREKYTRQGLALFLIDPATSRPAGRMPSLKLRALEAADITAYLMAGTMPEERSTNAAAPVSHPQRHAEGARLFSELGCANCHTATGALPRLQAKPLRSLNTTAQRGCISAQAQHRLPHYRVDQAQRTALIAAIQAERTGPATKSEESAESAAKHVDQTMLRLNCYACHTRGERGGLARGRDRYFETIGQVDLGDEGRLPPPLTAVGRKLTSAWLENVLKGSGDIRPYLQVRMPKYPSAEVLPLVHSLAAADAGASTIMAMKTTDSSLAEAGRAIFNAGCVQCHPVRGESLPSVIGVDVGRISKRIRPEWFQDFLVDPASLKRRTRMPTFFAQGSINKEILGGDVHRQIAAVRSYLDDIDRQPLPEKIEEFRRQGFELVPKQRPIVLRTFMKVGGTHSIAVGLPQQVHFAFDAESIRLAELWRGRFLDAQGTWNDRFTPPAEPLSQVSITMPPGPEFALLASQYSPWPVGPVANERQHDSKNINAPRFLGYRLDKQGVPEFKYELGRYVIGDRIVADTPATPKGDERVALRRDISIHLEKPAESEAEIQPSQLWFRAATSSQPLIVRGRQWTSASGLIVTLPADVAAKAVASERDGQSLCLLPLPVASETTLRIEYRW